MLKLTHVAKFLKLLFVGYGQAPPRLSLPQNVLYSNILTCTSLIQTKNGFSHQQDYWQIIIFRITSLFALLSCIWKRVFNRQWVWHHIMCLDYGYYARDDYLATCGWRVGRYDQQQWRSQVNPTTLWLIFVTLCAK